MGSSLTPPLGAVAFSLIGVHSIDEPGWFDAFDAAVELSDGSIVCFGARTPESLDPSSRSGSETERWGEYQPIPVTLDFSTVDHYDFAELLWLGPEPRPCLVWTNATALNTEGVATILRHGTEAEDGKRLFDGRDGAGLPSPTELAIDVAGDAVWNRLRD